MGLYSKPEDMLENFQIPPETFPAFIPTSPSLPIKDLKITDAKNIGDTRKVNKYQVVHNNPRHSIEFQITITSETNYNYKALSLIKIMNQMMMGVALSELSLYAINHIDHNPIRDFLKDQLIIKFTLFNPRRWQYMVAHSVESIANRHRTQQP